MRFATVGLLGVYFRGMTQDVREALAGLLYAAAGGVVGLLAMSAGSDSTVGMLGSVVALAGLVIGVVYLVQLGRALTAKRPESQD